MNANDNFLFHTEEMHGLTKQQCCFYVSSIIYIYIYIYIYRYLKVDHLSL